MHRPSTIVDSHVHLVTAGTREARRLRMARLHPSLREAYERRWQASLASRHEVGREPDPPDVHVVARRWQAALDAAGIARAVFFASSEHYEDLLTFITIDPQRFVGYTSLDPTDPSSAALLARQVEDYGVRGVKLYPMANGFHVDDERCAAMFEVCEAKRLPVVIHFGLSINATHDLRYGNPIDLSGPALRFPSARWIIPHFGAGFFREALMVAAQHQNVHIDSSSSNNWVERDPHGFTVAELFRRTIDAIGADRLIFGTDSSFFPRGYRTNLLDQHLAICHDLGLPPEDIDAIFGGTITRLLADVVPTSAKAPPASIVRSEP